MIELAPDHKIGLPLSHPVLIASGCCGYGSPYQRLIDLKAFGAVVTNPITLRPRRGATGPRLVETSAGFIIDTGLQNPGIRNVLQQHRKIWPRLEVPVIAHLPADEPDDLGRTARALTSSEAIVAIELGVPYGAPARDLEPWIRAIHYDCPLPLLAKLPLDRTLELAEAAVDAYADALVIGSPPLASALSADGLSMVEGFLYSPSLHAITLQIFREVKQVFDLPLIAAGGIHTLADAKAYLRAGASAVQIDSLLFIDPFEGLEIARNLQLVEG